jgi:hypothetical protein
VLVVLPIIFFIFILFVDIAVLLKTSKEGLNGQTRKKFSDVFKM